MQTTIIIINSPYGRCHNKMSKLFLNQNFKILFKNINLNSKSHFQTLNQRQKSLSNFKKYLMMSSKHNSYVREVHTSATMKNNDENKSPNTQPKPQSNKPTFNRIMSLAKPEATKLAGAVGLLTISSGVTLSVPFCMGRLIDLIQEASVQGTMDGTLQQMAVGLSAMFIVGGVANAGRVYLLQSAGIRIMRRLREKVYSSIIGQEVAFFDKSRTGELINRLASDTEIVSSSVTQNLSDGLRSLAQVSAGIGMMFYMSPQLASVVLMVVPPVAGIGILYGRFVRKITRKTQTALANSTHTAEEKISNIRTVRAFAQEDEEMNLYSRMVYEVQKFGHKEAIARGIFYGFLGFSGNMVMLLVLYKGGVMMHSSVITVGNLSAFLLYSGYVGISIAGLSKFYSELNRSIGASERLWELADRIPMIPISGGEVPHLDLLHKDITFQNISFSYPMRSEKPIFDNLNLTIKAGNITAVVGASGSGKSTIASLLLRFYEPSSGHIKIGDMDLNTLDPQWMRKNIGTVSQEPVLFSGTIRENIVYGTPGSIEEEDLVDAARKSNSLDFIESLPEKFETLVGERGITLSGGQRQRVAIARALLKNPKILLLDEATSALDAESEHLVQEALERLMIGRTTLTIAHRLSTIKNADKIAVLGFTDEMIDEGTYVVEEGSYSDLMSIEGGAFRKLVERQTMHNSQT